MTHTATTPTDPPPDVPLPAGENRDCPAIIATCRIQRAIVRPRVIEQPNSTSRWLKGMSGPPTGRPTVAATCIATLPVNTSGPLENIAPKPNPPEMSPTSKRTRATAGPS
jgi:hypothetical protein